MQYKVEASDFTKAQFASYVKYIRDELKNEQAVDLLLDDAVLTERALSVSAESLAFCKDPNLKSLGYRMILFRSHRYLWIYRVVDDTAQVHAMYHELQDYENMF